MNEILDTEIDTSDFLYPSVQSDSGDFEAITPVDTSGATSLTFVVSIKGKEYFMKRLKPELKDNQAFYNLYHKEFDLGQRLDSPYIVKYHDLVEDDQGVYILCERVCGATLDQKIKVAPEWFTARCNLDRMFCQLLDALEHMHDSHVVHADLKPQNLMLTRINNDVKVIDLGFAFADDYTLSAGCTPGYAAPELQQGSSDTLGVCTDIYGIGKLLEYIHTETDRGLPKVYRRIMHKCLHEEQSKRFQSTEEVRKAILHRKHVLRNLSISSTILGILVLAAYIFFNTSTGVGFAGTILWSMRKVSYDVDKYQIFYKYCANDSSKCMVVGGRVSVDAAGEDDGDNIKIRSYIIRPNGDTSRVVAIADSAFFRGKNFTSLYIPDGVETIGFRAFEHCKKITVINLPPSVREVGDYAFGQINSLRTLHLPDSLEKIPIGMAHHALQLTRVAIPPKVRVLPLDVFASCIALKEVILPPHLERIERGVFWECRNLPQITLPATMKYIGEFSFYHCDNLKHVYLHAVEPPQMCNAFSKSSKVTIHVPKESATAYKANIDWKDMTIIGDL